MANSERLQKIISAAGITSRRKAELLIRQGRVTVNGSVITELGAKADPDQDHVKVDGKLIRRLPAKIYILLNKPRQVVSSVSDPQGRVKVTDLIKSKQRLFPVGRLDYDTEGLILLTNDGEFARIVSCAGGKFPKVYQVKVRNVPDEATLDRLRAGIRLKDGTQLRRCKIVGVKAGQSPWFEVTLFEGKNREIREMFAALGHPVQKLRRTRIGFLTAKGLPLGRYRMLQPKEVDRFLKAQPSGEIETTRGDRRPEIRRN
jgi:23S rRNA pseudouridine2605 synthase